MLRSIRTASMTALASSCLLLAGPGLASAATAPATAPAASPAAAQAITPCTSTNIIKVDSFAFNPAQVAPGQSSTATLSTTNCTAATQSTSETWYGKFLGPTPGIPAGCPVIDPFARSVTYPPHATEATATSYLVFSGCTATELEIIVTITGSGGTTLAQATAYLHIS